MDENKVCINLKTIYDEQPAYVKIISENKTVFDSLVKENTNVEFTYSANKKRFKIQLIKTGNSLQKQKIIIEDILLNGCSLHPKFFGTFNSKSSTIQTTCLALNGDWNINVPLFNLNGESAINRKSFRDKFEDSDIACFGCSFTYGYLLEPTETWPSHLSKLLGKKIKNFGIKGSNNQEIIATALDYSSKYKVRDIIILLCHFCRLQLKDKNEIYSWYPTHPNKKLEKQFYNIISQIVNYGESSVIFARQVLDLKENIKQIKENISGNVYISSYIPEQYDILKNVGKFLNILPMYKLSQNYLLASDDHHPGPEHNRQFAKSVVQYIND
tara:strand:- start:722 stop:1705 length:984 start_codon:yes stop_codon:yes gene_type:complete